MGEQDLLLRCEEAPEEVLEGDRVVDKAADVQLSSLEVGESLDFVETFTAAYESAEKVQDGIFELDFEFKQPADCLGEHRNLI